MLCSNTWSTKGINKLFKEIWRQKEIDKSKPQIWRKKKPNHSLEPCLAVSFPPTATYLECNRQLSRTEPPTLELTATVPGILTAMRSPKTTPLYPPTIKSVLPSRTAAAWPKRPLLVVCTCGESAEATKWDKKDQWGLNLLFKGHVNVSTKL